jgi:hypothetical protein
MQLQMVDQSIRFSEGIAKDMGEEEDDTPIVLERSFLNATNAIIYVKSG